MNSYQVMKVTATGFGAEAATTEVVWEGTDLDELSSRFPRSKVMGADELGHHEIEDGYIRWDHRFQMRAQAGEWQEIEDPRHAVRDARQAALEAAIDAENRRNFPGDFDGDFDNSDFSEEDDGW